MVFIRTTFIFFLCQHCSPLFMRGFLQRVKHFLDKKKYVEFLGHQQKRIIIINEDEILCSAITKILNYISSFFVHGKGKDEINKQGRPVF